MFYSKFVDPSLEFAPAVLEILELIEAGAGRRQQHGIAVGGVRVIDSGGTLIGVGGVTR